MSLYRGPPLRRGLTDAVDQSPIPEIYISKLQSLLPHFNEETIARSLSKRPNVIVDSVRAVKAAMSSSSLAVIEQPFPSASMSTVQNSFELIHKLFVRPELWVQSGFTFRQLESIRLAFMNALSSQEERANAEKAKKYVESRAETVQREIYIQKRTRSRR